MTIELLITLKDSEKTLRNRFLSYNVVTLDPTDPYIKECLDTCLSQFTGKPEDIIIKATMVCQ